MIYIITGCGAKNSLGYRIASKLKKYNPDCYIFGIVEPEQAETPANLNDPVDHYVGCDLQFETQIYFAYKFIDSEIRTLIAEKRFAEPGFFICLINCAGINYNEWLEFADDKMFDIVFAVNTRAPYLLAKHFLKLLAKTKGTILNIVSNAATIPMRCSTAYNVSKAGEKMLTLQLARELTIDKGITVFSVSPNKLKCTGMSNKIDADICRTRGFSKEEAEKYQSASLVTGEQTDPEILADFIAYLLHKKENHFYLSGCDMPYGA